MTELIAYSHAGTFLANSPPHLDDTLSGRRFPAPLIQPRGIGVPSSTNNVPSGAANFAAFGLLAGGIGVFGLHRLSYALAISAGARVLRLAFARHFGAQSGGKSPHRREP